MKTIHKYTLTPNAIISMPVDAKLLCVQMQDGEPRIWAEVDTNRPYVGRRFVTVGTGHDLDFYGPIRGPYLGTFQKDWLVFHVYDCGQC